MNDTTHPPKRGHGRITNLASAESLDAVWTAIEEGRIEEALDIAETLTREHPEDGEAHLAQAAATYEAGLPDAALEAARRAGQLGIEDHGLQAWYEAAGLVQLWKLDEARPLLERLLKEDASFADAWYLLGQVCETAGDQIGARRGYDRAFELEPDRFPRPSRIDEGELDRVIALAREDLPEPFQKALDEVPVVVRPLPTYDMAKSGAPDEPPLPPDLLGLFVGSSNLDRSVFNPVEQPGVIFLFQTNLERICPDRETLAEEVRITLWHELAHYLGFEEEDMHRMGLE
jgi:predicted Zn-dependent protease with MMP-like domain